MMHLKILIIFGLVIPILANNEILNDILGHGLNVKCKLEPCLSMERVMMMKSMNESVRPCDDFYAYVCSNETFYDPFSLIEYSTITGLSKLINEITTDSPNYLKKLKQFYMSCLDEVRLNKNSENNFRRIRNNLGGWPAVDKRSLWREPKYQWPNVTHEFRKIGYPINYFFNFIIDASDDDVKKKMIHLDQPSFGLDQVYLIQGLNSTVVQAYLEYMVDVAKMLGASDDVRQELERSLEFEIKLAEISLLPKQRQNHRKLYNIITIKELQSKYPDIQWLDYINGITRPCIRIRDSEKINVRVPGFFNKFFKLMNERKLNGRDLTNRDLANYAMWRVTLDSVDHLSSRIRNAELKFKTTVLGQEPNVDRQRKCINEMRKKMYVAMSSLFVRHYFNDNMSKSIKRVFNNVRSSIEKFITELDWMDNETKSSALEKLNNVELTAGYHEDILNDVKLDKYYQDFNVNDKNYLNSSLNFNVFFTDTQIKTFRKPFIKSDWTLIENSAVIVNAMNTRMNTIHMPAAIMHKLIYSRDNPNYLNYGILGYILGHEMMHAFDTAFRSYDKEGNMVDWWSLESTSQYLNKSQCIIDHYNNYTIDEIDMNVDGDNTLSENMADIGGLKAAYYAYRTWRRKRPEEHRLHGYESTSPKKLFWIAFASLFCDSASPNIVRHLIYLDQHAPNKYRVIGALRNLPEFAKDFRCKPGDAMYSDSNARCDMW